LRAPGTGEVYNATESGPELVRSGDGIHDKYVVSQHVDSGAIGQNRPADGRCS
jgi:hypothetical protein